MLCDTLQSVGSVGDDKSVVLQMSLVHSALVREHTKIRLWVLLMCMKLEVMTQALT
jgi:hypothetical protein